MTESQHAAQPPNELNRSASFFTECWNRKPWLLLVVALIAVHSVAAVETARYSTVTHDEYWHIPVGLLNLRHARFDFDNLNPPLGRMLAAAPLVVLANPVSDDAPAVTDDIWSYGDDFHQANSENYRTLIFAARLPGIVLSVIFAFIAADWSARIFSFHAGVATLALWCFSPSLISMAALATNDLFVSGLFLVSLRLAWSLGHSPRWSTAMALGGSIGISCLVKFTGLLLFALAPISAASTAVLLPVVSKRRPARVFGLALTGLLVAIATINAGYLFQGTGVPIGQYQLKSQSCQWLQSISPSEGIPVPFPKDFLNGVDHQRLMMESQHPVYLNGHWNQTGFRSYFFWVFVWKVPHALQLLLCLIPFLAFRQRRDGRSLQVVLILSLPAVVLTVIGSISSMQLGLRYILPALPCLIVLCGLPFSEGSASYRKTRWLACACVCVSLLSLRHHPQHLAYFNEFAEGPEQGWRMLGDSNVDWGQDLHAFADYYKSHPEIEDLRLAYFGTFPPGRLGIEYRLPPSAPEAGWYAMSVNILQGRPNPLRKQDGTTEHVFGDPFTFLRFFEPIARIGASIHVFHITEDDLMQRRIEIRTSRHRL